VSSNYHRSPLFLKHQRESFRKQREQDTLKKVTGGLNKLLSRPEFQHLLPRTPRFRYYQVKGDSYAFAWTTERCSGKFYTLKYRLLKPTKQGQIWRLIKKVAFGKRRVAKARALRWYEQRKKKKEGS